MDSMWNLFVLILFVLVLPVIFMTISYFRKQGNKKMDNCKVCKKEVAANASSCPHCGARLSIHPVLGCLLWVVIIVVVIVVVLVIIAYAQLRSITQ